MVNGNIGAWCFRFHPLSIRGASFVYINFRSAVSPGHWDQRVWIVHTWTIFAIWSLRKWPIICTQCYGELRRCTLCNLVNPQWPLDEPVGELPSRLNLLPTRFFKVQYVMYQNKWKCLCYCCSFVDLKKNKPITKIV